MKKAEKELLAFVRGRLARACDPAYREFVKPYIKTDKNILGVRIPILHKLAKEIALKDPDAYLVEREDAAYEETLLRGLVIAYARKDNAWRFEALRAFIPLVSDWAVCDVACAALKPLRREREAFLVFLQPYLTSKKEFEIRFALVALMDHFLTPEYARRFFKEISKADTTAYYAAMGLAWGIATAMRKFPKETADYLKKTKFSPELKKLMIKKIRESRAVPAEIREIAENILLDKGGRK